MASDPRANPEEGLPISKYPKHRRRKRASANVVETKEDQTPVVTQDEEPKPKRRRRKGKQVDEIANVLGHNNADQAVAADEEKMPKVETNSHKEIPTNDRQASNPLLTKDGMLQKIQSAKKALQTEMLGIYGDYYWDIFEPKLEEIGERKSVGDHFFYKSPTQLLKSLGLPKDISEESLGWKRMVRLLLIKLLQVQLGLLEGKDSYTSLRWVTSGNG